MNIEESKRNIAKLVEKYNRLKEENKIKDFNEAQTRNEFIEPLFGFLGWDMRNIKFEREVTTEEQVSNGRVDLAFRTNGIPKFFLEAKSMKVDLDIESYAKQAIRYSWNKGVDYAVLTDFENIKLFNAQTESKSLLDKLIFEISCNEFISDFDRLWLLSKESFEINGLDNYAEKYGKKSKKLTVNEKLFGDLKKAREFLTKAFGDWKENWKNGFDQEVLDEGVQRIIDRLVFIRVLEDRGLEPSILKQMIHEWDSDRSGNRQLFQMLIEKFRELDGIYNSNLFTKHACEDWEEYSDAVKKTIEILYGDEIHQYDFKEIPADILGGVYESYLGYIAQNPINEGHKKGKLFELDDKSQIKMKSRKKRKEHGIYYTPRFIVDYIVKNTLGEKLKETKSIGDIKKLKVLDPACGSGSFLTKALETINEKYKDFGNPGNQYTKAEILSENIFGVDLDSQAVELAKLNLLLDTLDEKAKLPTIENVKVGNSLISGDEKELKGYFGKDWKEKKPFNWEEKFPQVFAQGGFDVIIGNPPYVRVDTLDIAEKNYWNEKFKTSTGKYDLYYLFIEKSLNLLKNDGILGFIVPNKFCVADSANELREFIFNVSSYCNFFSVSKIEVFKSASNYPVVIIIRKGNNDQKVKLSFAEKEAEILNGNFSNYLINKKKLDVLPSKIIPVNVTEKDLDIVTNLISNNDKLSKYLKISEGLRISEKYEKTEKKEFGIVKQYQFERYSGIKRGSFISYEDIGKVVSEKSNRFLNSQKEKILIAEDALSITATIDKNKNIPQGGVYFGTEIDNKSVIKYLLALLNSRLLSFVYKVLFGGMHMGGGYLRYRTKFLDELPIKIVSEEKRKEIVCLVDKILSFNNQLKVVSENSDKWNEVKKEIEKTDKEIDVKVYDLYGLTEEEIKIIEND